MCKSEQQGETKWSSNLVDKFNGRGTTPEDIGAMKDRPVMARRIFEPLGAWMQSQSSASDDGYRYSPSIG